jgi:hypothetical protein
VFALVLGLRAALLPVWPIPTPTVTDEMSYLLMSDTFAHGRIANPPHALWQFFETVHVLGSPGYASKFFPAQGLFLALGQVLFQSPWYGVWLSCGAMAAGTTWAAFGWLPPPWALFAGILTLPMSITSYWMNSYWGGAVAALGGALAVGALGRLVSRKGPVTSLASVLAVGSVLVCWSRPFEGLVLLIPLFLYLIWKTWRVLPARAWLVVAAIGGSGAAALLYYDARLTGSPWIPPEAAYQRQYGMAPVFAFQELGAPKSLRDPHMEMVHNTWERDLVLHARTPAAWAHRPIEAWNFAALFAGGSWVFLVSVTVFCVPVLRRRTGVLAVFSLLGVAASLVEIAYLAHYAAPFYAATVIPVAEGFRMLRGATFRGAETGRFLSRVAPTVGFLFVMAQQGLMLIRADPDAPMTMNPLPTVWRERLAASLPPGKNVILVRYDPPYNEHAHWVYNGADIDASSVIWARDLGTEENRSLRAYYPDRKFWLLRPNQNLDSLEPYP